jgi:tRNA1Val (adenine37-N6)-methyltransferase
MSRASRRSTVEHPTLGALTRDRLTRDVWVEQRARGHRFSSDDMATAFLACRAAPNAQRVLDLGCGLGSVLLHLAWSLPRATLVGVEAQAVSYALLERNVANSGFAGRVAIHHGDLRDETTVSALASHGAFDLITGTPPYFPAGTALDSTDEQRAYARIEYRGGVEAYLEAGARLLANDGVVVLCGDTQADERVGRAAESARLGLAGRCDVIPREGEPALFTIWTLRRVADDAAETPRTRMTLRDRGGARTDDAAALRAFSGL